MATNQSQELRVLNDEPGDETLSYYVSRPCDSELSPCNHCDLMERCYELYGADGQRCPIVANRQVWLRLADGIVEHIKGEDPNR